MFLTEQGCLLRRKDSGENYLLLIVFLANTGMKQVLARRRIRPAAGGNLPDLLEVGDYSIEQKDPASPAYLREYVPSQRHPGLGQGYARLAAASQLARFYERNLQHLESFQHAWNILQKALAGFATRDDPQSVLFKALFLFARSEGYAVTAQWLEGLPEQLRARVTALLRHPVGQVPVEAAEVRDWTQQLYRFFEQHTDLLPPDL